MNPLSNMAQTDQQIIPFNNVCAPGILDTAAWLEKRDLNYMTRSKSAKKEQR